MHGEPRLRDDDFRALITRHRGRLLEVCIKLTGSRELAEDLCQEACAKAWAARHTFEGRSAFSTWLIGFAKYLSLNDRRKKGDLLTEDGVVDVSDPGASVLKDLTADERYQLLEDCIQACLDPTEQEVAWLRYAEEMPLDQITTTLQLTQTSGARGMLQTIRRKLRAEMMSRLSEMGHGTSFIRTRW